MRSHSTSTAYFLEKFKIEFPLHLYGARLSHTTATHRGYSTRQPIQSSDNSICVVPIVCFPWSVFSAISAETGKIEYCLPFPPFPAPQTKKKKKEKRKITTYKSIHRSSSHLLLFYKRVRTWLVMDKEKFYYFIDKFCEFTAKSFFPAYGLWSDFVFVFSGPDN